MLKKEQVKERLDARVAREHQHLSRNQIQNFILEGKVLVDGKVITKSGTQVTSENNVELTREEPKFVSRAGFKLEAALQQFGVDVSGLTVLDAGISTGGFTDCLLQHGVSRVYGIDVGSSEQVHEKIRSDTRVVLLENTNLRHLEKLSELVDLATLDLSFISLLKVIPAVKNLLKPDGRIIALIKPQFEAERSEIGKGGLVKDDKVHAKVIEKIKLGMQEFGFEMIGVIESPILGATSGNKEFLGYFVMKE